MKQVEIITSFKLTGRGTILVTDLDYDTNHSNYKKGDIVAYDNKKYEIFAIEALLREINPDEYNDCLSFVVKEKE